MKVIHPRKIFVISILIAVIVFLVVFTFGGLLYRQVINTNNKMTQVKQSTDERSRVLALRDSIDQSEIERARLVSFFVGASDIDTANQIDALELMAKQNGLLYDVKSVSYEEIFGGTNYNNLGFLKIKIRVSGPWNNVLRFIKYIEAYPKLTSITNLVLENSNNLWSAEIDFVVSKLK